MNLGIALKAFFAVLFDKQKSEQVRLLLSGQTPNLGQQQKEAPIERAPQPKAEPPTRNAAVTLLATLQREARIIDLVHEDLSQFSDAQVGAAARPCLQQCAGVLNRLFSLQPVVEASEGETVTVEHDASPMRYQWIGEGNADAGKLVHHGWQASKVELPQWSGEAADANIVAPAQLQTR